MADVLNIVAVDALVPFKAPVLRMHLEMKFSLMDVI
jgi:hypothetical protein